MSYSNQTAKRDRYAQDDVPTPRSPSGQYPGPVWVEASGTGYALGAEIATPPSATGQYPGQVWADDSETAQAQAADDSIPAPPSATGQYPDPVWSEIDYAAAVAETSGVQTAEPVPQQNPSPAPHRTRVEEAGSASGKPAGNAQPADVGSGATSIALENQEIYRIIRAVAANIAGDDLYEHIDTSTVATDGLRAGLLGFRQANGQLGQLLQIMQRRDPSLLAVIMGADTPVLLEVATADSRDQRLQPVGGLPLWHESWQIKWRQAGQQAVFQAAQNEMAIEHQFRPLLDAARSLRLHSDRGLALLLDRAVALGEEAGVQWVRQHLAPASGATEAVRLQALVEAAAPETESRLQNVLTSSLLDGSTYAF